MNRYQSYKSSGVEWIGDIPQKWNIIRLKHEYKIQKGKIPKVIHEENKDGLVPYLSMEVIRSSEYNSFVNKEEGVYVNGGQIIILWDGSNSGEIFKVNIDGILSSTMGVLNKVGNRLNEDFSFYFLKSSEPEIRNNTNGMGIPHVDGSYVRNLPIFIPPLKEQYQIVQFLDEKTELIDKLISTKERKISLLKEQRTSLINQVVTKGLNFNVKMKDCLVEWIGEIPEHWGVKKFTYITDVINCGYTSTPEYVDEGVMFLSSQNVKKGKLDLWKYNFISRQLHEELTKNRKVKKGDLLVVRVGVGIGNSCVVEIDDEFSIYVSLTHVSLKDGYLNYYFNYLFNSTNFIDECILLSKQGGGVGNFNVKDFERFKFPIPPYNEQIQIVDYLDSKTKEIDDLIQLEQKKINLLQEYRQSLISEVVTGKIKVTTDE